MCRVYSRYVENLPPPFSSIHRRYHAASGVGLYIKEACTLPAFQLEVPETSGNREDKWTVHVVGGASVYSDPHSGFSPGMLVNESVTASHGSQAPVVTGLPAVFRSVTKADHFRVMTANVHSGARDKLVPASYKDDPASIVVLEIQPRTYPKDFQLFTFYGREFARDGYVRGGDSAAANSAPPMVNPISSQATDAADATDRDSAV